MANPPIVIGPFDNVPAPGSPIRSDWPQEISLYVVENSIPNVINTVPEPSGQLRIESAYIGVTTDANGDAVIVMGGAGAFAANPMVIVSSAQPTPPLGITVMTTSSTSFTVRAHRLDTGAAFTNGGVTLFWLAIGHRP